MTAAGDRNETPTERLDRNWAELLSPFTECCSASSSPELVAVAHRLALFGY